MGAVGFAVRSFYRIYSVLRTANPKDSSVAGAPCKAQTYFYCVAAILLYIPDICYNFLNIHKPPFAVILGEISFLIVFTSSRNTIPLNSCKNFTVKGHKKKE